MRREHAKPVRAARKRTTAPNAKSARAQPARVTSAKRRSKFALLQRSAKRGELLLQLDRHRLGGYCLAHEDAQVLLEAVALAAVVALVEVRLRLLTLRIG